MNLIKNSKLLIVLLSVLLVLLSGCGMETQEVVKAVTECKKAGLKPVQFINGFSNKTSHIRCDVINEKKAN